MHEFEYVKKNPVPEVRREEAKKIREKYPDRVPVICEKADSTDNQLQEIGKTKYLVPGDLNVGQFAYIIRKRIKLPPETALFLMVNQILPPHAAMMSQLYDEHQAPDSFLYMTYSGEKTFGA